MDEPPAIRPARRMSKLSRILSQAGLRPDRRFAQCFLVNQGALETIARAARVGARGVVYEIGAGLGNLTELLAQDAGEVVAVELDRNFQRIHERHFRDARNIRFVYGDILETPLAGLAPPGAWDETVVVGNIPYSITSRILMKLLNERDAFDRAYVLMQREVAERLTARPGHKQYSVLTAKLHCAFRIDLAFRVGRRSFLPPPRVDSALVELRKAREVLAADPAERAEFFAMLDGAFGQRRKVLPNSLSHATGGGWPREEVAAAMEALGVDAKARGEELDVAALYRLFHALRAKLGPGPFRARGR